MSAGDDTRSPGYEYARDLALAAVSFGLCGHENCPGCGRTSAITLLLGAIILLCRAGDDPLAAMDNAIDGLRDIRALMAKAATQKGPPS